MIPDLISAEIVTIWVAKGGLDGRSRARKLQELAALFAKAMKAVVAEENEACADICDGCHFPALAQAIRDRTQAKGGAK